MELSWKITNETTTELMKIGILLKHHICESISVCTFYSIIGTTLDHFFSIAAFLYRVCSSWLVHDVSRF